MPAPIDNDHELTRRLELLEAYDVLNTPAEPEFDDIALMASEVCRTPVSLVSLVEKDRQWFKARVGFEACETPIERSVCAHSLSSPDLLIIPDLSVDPRTKDNTLVTEPPHIRFYAGAPLIGADGIAIGTLCVIDTVPRPDGLDATQKKVLAALGRQVIAHLESRRISHRKDELFRRQKGMSANIRATATRNLAAQEAGGVGTFEINIASGVITTSPEVCRIFDLPIAPTYPAKLLEDMVIEADQGLQSNDQTRADQSAAMNVEYRISTPGRGLRWISRHAVIETDADGKASKMRGTIQDITVPKRATLRTQALLELGDHLRDLDTVEEMAISAAHLMGKALDAVRAGFATVDPRRELVTVLPDYCASGFSSVAGPHYFKDYAPLIGDMQRGEAVVVPDVASDPRMSTHAERLIGIGARVITLIPILDHGRFNLMVFVHHDWPHEWTAEDIAFVRSFGDRIQIAIARLQSEEDQITLNREIGHRLKNTFAMIQAIATQTLRPVSERDHVVRFEKRLHALSRAHDILLNEPADASIRAIVESMGETLAMPERLHIAGPDITIGPRGALSLGLLLHELGTNAMKYGALSREGGLVAVRWSVDNNQAEPSLTFSWKETGGPAPKKPERKGFGSKLIQMGLIGTGAVLLSYDPPGFSAEMSAPLQQLQQGN